MLNNIPPQIDKIIHSMCMTYNHSYGLVVTEEDRARYPLMSGMTESQRKALYNNMLQIFYNDIYPHMKFIEEGA